MAYSPKFRAKVALEAIQGFTTLALVAEKYGVHQVVVSRWKKQLLDAAEYIFTPAFKKQENEEFIGGEERFSDQELWLVDSTTPPIIEPKMESVRDFKKEPAFEKVESQTLESHTLESQTLEPKENALDALVYEKLGRLMIENAYLKKKIAFHGE